MNENTLRFMQKKTLLIPETAWMRTKANDGCIITAIINIVGKAAFKIGIGVDLLH
jgi:hypothetical protein